MQGCFRDRVLDFIYPARCPVCDDVLPAGMHGICAGCHTYIQYIREPRCMRCGKPLEEDEEFCGDCRDNSRSFEAGRALFVYDGIMQESMARFKYSSRREYGAVYAEELYRHYGSWVKQTGAGMLVPVPVHPARYRRRGYNQAEILARHFGKLSGLPVGTEMIARMKDTRPQKELSAGERKRNLAGAFSVGRQVRELNQIPECVIIMDDIYTTGSTMEACSAVLKETGIRRIYFLCVCIGQGN